jgi:O-antigen ligase
MSAIAGRQHVQAGVLALTAAAFAASIPEVIYRGPGASGYALADMALLALALLSVLVYTRPLVALCIALIFMTSPLSLVLSLQWSALVSALLLTGACLGVALRTPLRTMVPDPLFLPIAIFTIYGLLSAVYGLFLGNEVGYLLGDLFQIIEFAAVYFLTVQLLSDGKKIHLFLRVLFISMMITVFVELVLFALGPAAGDLLPSWDGSYISGSLVRTVDIDATILFAVLINLYATAASGRLRLWTGLALVPTVANIALSLSRGLWLCTLVIIIMSVMLSAGRARARLLTTFGFLAVCVAMLAGTWKISSGSVEDTDVSLLDVLEERVYYGADQVSAGLAGEEGMATRRFLEMAIVGPQVLAKPWIGYGLGATYVIGGFAVLDSGTKGLIDNHFIHNLYLVTAFRLGMIGLGLLLWLLFRYFRRIRRAFKNMPMSMAKALIAGFIACAVGQMFLSITQPTIVDHPTCALIASAMALSFRLASLNSPADSQRQEVGAP